MVGGFVHDDEMACLRDAKGEEELAGFAGAGVLGLEEAFGV